MTELRNRARYLSYFTVGYNVVEGLIALAFATLAGSPALLGFGIDSFVESLSGGVMIWRFSRSTSSTCEDETRREQTAIRWVGLSLLILAAYVVYESAEKLIYRESPERNIAGLLIAIVSLIVMPILFLMKRDTASALGSRSLAVDAKQTLACILLSMALLIGNGLHYMTGLWQADPIAALIIAAFLIREGYEAWTKQQLCCP